MRFYMVDRVQEICFGKYVEAVKCISMTDDVFNEHFPGYPIFPGSLILEGLAQLSGLFFEKSLADAGHTWKRAVLVMVNRFKIREMAFPGDRLVYRAESKSFYPEEYSVAKVTAFKEGKICAEGELVFGFIDIMDDDMKNITRDFFAFGMKDARIVEE